LDALLAVVLIETELGGGLLCIYIALVFVKKWHENALSWLKCFAILHCVVQFSELATNKRSHFGNVFILGQVDGRLV